MIADVRVGFVEGTCCGVDCVEIFSTIVSLSLNPLASPWHHLERGQVPHVVRRVRERMEAVDKFWSTSRAVLEHFGNGVACQVYYLFVIDLGHTDKWFQHFEFVGGVVEM